MPAEGAEFIESRDVVEVLVRVEHGIYDGDFFPKCLLSKVGPAIDEEAAPRSFKNHRTAGTLVVGMLRAASRTGAADDRHSDGGCGAKKKEVRLRSRRSHRCIGAIELHNPPATAKPECLPF